MKIKSLNNISLEKILEAFSKAFADYDFQLNKSQIQAMLKRRGFNPDLSFAAFEDDEIVSFTLNGIGHLNGMLTAYDTGTGTIKNYRGQHLAKQIFEYSIPYLKEANIKQYLLEVLQHNTKAISIYKNLGFEVIREFNYFIQKKEEINNEFKTTNITYAIKQIDIREFKSIVSFWDFHPSWQNSFESIERVFENFISLGLFYENKLIGYCVFEPASGELPQIAVDKQNRKQGVATLLFNEIMKLNNNDTIRILNTDVLCHSITDFLKSKNIDIKGKQFEMLKII